jgi:hypothetical protein
VSERRPQVSPNAGFMARLIRLEESLHGTKTMKVRDRGLPHPWLASSCRMHERLELTAMLLAAWRSADLLNPATPNH